MLNVLRENFKETPWLKLVLALVGVSMILYLGSYFVDSSNTQAASAWVAKVNGSEIPEYELRNRAQNLDRYYRQLFGENYDRIRQSLPLREQALQVLIERELILQDAARLGLSGSDRELAQRIRNHPYFRDSNEQFVGDERYKQIVKRTFGTVEAFENRILADIVVEKWSTLVGQPVDVPADELEQVFRKRTEKTAVDYVVVAADDSSAAQVDQAAVAAWYDSHQDDYRRVEGRKIRLVTIDREAQRAKVLITDEEARAYYDANQASFGHPAQRRARHILFRVPPGGDEAAKSAARERAEATLARLTAGEDFDTLARELSDDAASKVKGGDLGFFGMGDMVGPFQEAAFATAVGQLAPVTESPYGFHVLQVTDQRDEGVSPLEDVLDDIRQRLEFTKAEERVQTEATRIHATISSIESFAAVAAAEGLKVEERTVRRDDRLRDLGASPDLLSAISTLEPGSVSGPLRLGAGMALVAVDELLPPSVAPLAEVEEQVRQAVAAHRARQAALAKARSALTDHPSLEAAAKALKLEVQESGDLAPGQSLPGVAGPTPTVERALFADGPAVGAKGAIEVPSGAVLYEVTGREPFDASRFADELPALREELLREKRAGYVQALVDRLRKEQTVEINQERLERAVPVG